MTFWAPDETERCVALWGEGYSAEKIGVALGRTRNSVIRKVQSMKLPVRQWSGDHVVKGARARALPLKTAEPWDRPPKPRPVKTKPPVALAYEPEVLGEPNDFPKRGCLWINGVVTPGFRCCGQKRHGNSVWCEHHHAKAIAPQRGRSDDNGTNSRSTA